MIGFEIQLLGISSVNEMPPYFSPEIQNLERDLEKGEIYSLGGIGYFLLTRSAPKAEAQLIHEINSNVSQKTSNLIRACLSEDPELRPRVMQFAAKVNEILFPPEPVVEVRKKGLLEGPIRQVTPFASKLLEWTVMGGKALGERPLFLILLIVGGWIIYTNLHRHPFQKSFSKSSPLVYVACKHEVVVVNPETMKVVHEIPTIEQAFTSFISKDNGELWFATGKGNIYHVNPLDDVIVNKFSLGAEIGGIAKSYKNLLYVTFSRDNTVATCAASTGRVIAVCPVGQEPEEIFYNKNENELFLTNSQLKTLTVIDSQKNVVKEIINLDDVPDGMVQSPDGRLLYLLSNHSSRLDIIDTHSKQKINSMTLESVSPYSMNTFPEGLVITAMGGNQVFLYDAYSTRKKAQVYFSKPKLAIYLNQMNKILAINSLGYMYALDPATGRTLDHLRIGWFPAAMIYVP